MIRNPVTSVQNGEKPRLGVLKVGGSLLPELGLVAGLHDWLEFLKNADSPNWLGDGEPTAGLEPAPHADSASTPSQRLWVILVGGGQMADVVRNWDSTFGLAPAVSHRLALQAMSTTASLLAELTGWPKVVLGGSVTAGELWGMPDGTVPSPLIVDLADAALSDSRIPGSWDVTSDSLALWLAVNLSAERLVLLKRVNPLDDRMTMGKLEHHGWIDSYFSRMWSEMARPAIQVDIAHYFERPFRLTGVSETSD